MQTKDLIPSVAIAVYGGIGLLIGLVGTGLFYEACRDAGIVDLNQYLFEATVLNSLNLGKLFPILSSILLFLIVLASLRFRPRGRLIEVIFPICAFIVMVSIWFVKDLAFHGKLGWTGFLHASSLGGIVAMSLGTILDHRRLQDSIDHMLTFPLSNPKDKEIALKRLELEHNYMQTSLHWIVMGTIIFLTAAVAGYYYSPIGYQKDDPVIATRLLILFIGALWGIFGMFFGVILPNMRTMQSLREKTQDLMSKPSTQEKQEKMKEGESNAQSVEKKAKNLRKKKE